MTNSFENFYDTHNKEESNEKSDFFKILKLTLLALVFLYLYAPSKFNFNFPDSARPPDSARLLTRA